MEKYSNCKGYKLYIKDGYVISAYGQKRDGSKGTMYPYRWNSKFNYWINASGQVAYNTLRQKLNKEYILF